MNDDIDARIRKCVGNHLPTDVIVRPDGVVKIHGESPCATAEGYSVDNIRKLMVEIPHLFQKIGNGKQYWNTNSMTGKEKVEEWRKYLGGDGGEMTPCSHGDFIIGMLLLGYEYRGENEKKYPTLVFNATYRNLMKHTCECGLEYTKASEIQHKKSQAHIVLMKHHKGVSPPDPRIQDGITDGISGGVYDATPSVATESHPLNYLAWKE